MSMKIRFASLALAALLPTVAHAAPAESLLTYSGYLRTAAGSAETAAQPVTFTLYDAATAGTALWTDTLTATPDGNGWFSVILGATVGNSLPLGSFASQMWLGIKVGGEAEMAPRTKLTASAHALSVDWNAVTGRPAPCGVTGELLKGYDGAGKAVCASLASAGGVTSVGGAGPIVSSGGTSPTVGLSSCPGTNQILQWNGASWACISTPSGGGGTVTGVSAAAGTPISVANATSAPVLSMPAANGATSGYLSASDWTTFSNKISSVGGNAPISIGGTPTAPVVNISQASSTQPGFLSVIDWTTFNAKLGTVNRDASLIGNGAVSSPLGANLTAAGGNNGAASTVARGDHFHSTTISLSVNDFDPDSGTPTKSTNTFLTARAASSWGLPAAAYTGIRSLVQMPAGVTSAHPAKVQITLTTNTAAGGTVKLTIGTIGFPNGAAVPNWWVSNSLYTVSLTNKVTTVLSSPINTWAYTPAGTPVQTNPGDSFVLVILGDATNPIDIQILNAQVVFD